MSEELLGAVLAPADDIWSMLGMAWEVSGTVFRLWMLSLLAVVIALINCDHQLFTYANLSLISELLVAVGNRGSDKRGSIVLVVYTTKSSYSHTNTPSWSLVLHQVHSARQNAPASSPRLYVRQVHHILVSRWHYLLNNLSKKINGHGKATHIQLIAMHPLSGFLDPPLAIKCSLPSTQQVGEFHRLYCCVSITSHCIKSWSTLYNLTEKSLYVGKTCVALQDHNHEEGSW